jgi:hypothetical protein
MNVTLSFDHAAQQQMRHLLNLERYPIDRLGSPEGVDLVDHCRAALLEHGMFDLVGFVQAAAIPQLLAQVWPRIDSEGYRHARRHNIYFRDQIPGLADDHPVLAQFETAHRTLSGDQLTATAIERIYEWPPLRDFLSRVMDLPRLFLMDDALARLNVIGYGPGDALNWHFDRSQYTTTLLIRAPEAGGEFQYRSSLRSDTDPNYEGVARVVTGHDSGIAVHSMGAGTLNVFAGRNTAYRVTAVRGETSRLVAVFSYYDREGVSMSRAERIGFYGRDR